MEFYLLRTLPKSKLSERSAAAVLKTFKTTGVSRDKWTRVGERCGSEPIFCMSAAGKQDYVIGGTKGVFLFDNNTKEITDIEWTKKFWVNNVMVHKDLLFVFYRDEPMEVYQRSQTKGFTSVWTGPVIKTSFGGSSSWSMFGGYVEKTNKALYMLDNSPQQVVEINLAGLCEAVMKGNTEKLKHKYYGERISAFAVSQRRNNTLMYVDKESKLFVGCQEIRKIENESGSTNCIAAVDDAFVIGSYNGTLNIFELVSKTGKSLDTHKMTVIGGSNDIKDLKQINLPGVSLVVGLRIYHSIDLFLVHGSKLHLLMNDCKTRDDSTSSIVNHSQTIEVTGKSTFGVIVTQSEAVIATISFKV